MKSYVIYNIDTGDIVRTLQCVVGAIAIQQMPEGHTFLEVTALPPSMEDYKVSSVNGILTVITK